MWCARPAGVDVGLRAGGGDPARIEVEPDLATLLVAQGLPVEWLTVRRNGKWPDYEGGELDLAAGRGGWCATKQPSGEWDEFRIAPHKIWRSWLYTTVEETGIEAILDLVRRLSDAFDTCYGFLQPNGRSVPLPHYSLSGVFWVNLFGPAFVERWPGLAELGEPMANGGRIIRTYDDPWAPVADAGRAVRGVMGETPFSAPRYGGVPEPGAYVPSFEDHRGFSPGTMQMPWEQWLLQQDDIAIFGPQEVQDLCDRWWEGS